MIFVGTSIRRKAVFSILYILVIAGIVQAQDGTWNASGNSDWSVTSSWQSSIVANGTDATATFSPTATTHNYVFVNVPRTIGHLTRDWDDTKVMYIGGTDTLTLRTTTGTPTIDNKDTGGIANNFRIQINCLISGTNGLTVKGPGIVQLNNTSSSYTGNTTISGFLDFGGLSVENIGGGSSAGRNITVTDGGVVRFNSIDNSVLHRLAVTTNDIGLFTGTTGNDFDLSNGGTGAHLANAWIGNWVGNGAKTEYAGVLTPADDIYRFGHPAANGFFGIRSALTNGLNPRSLMIGGNRVELVGTNNTFSGDTVIQQGQLTLGNNLVLQNSALDLGDSGGGFALSDGTATGQITGDEAAPSPTFGGLKGSRDLLSAFSTTRGNNQSVLAASQVTGFTLNPIAGNTNTYYGAIADFATSTTLTKAGEGTQVLAGINTYTGATTINGGLLAGAPGGSCNNSDFTVNANGALGVVVTNTNQQWSCKSVTVSTNQATRLVFTFDVTPSKTLAPMVTQNDLIFSGTPVIEVLPDTLDQGKYPLLTVNGTAPTTAAPKLQGLSGVTYWVGNTLWMNTVPSGTVLIVQ